VTITLEPRPADSMSHLRGEHAIEGGYYYHGLIDVGITRPKSTAYVFYRSHIFLPGCSNIRKPPPNPILLNRQARSLVPSFSPRRVRPSSVRSSTAGHKLSGNVANQARRNWGL
jgi:hypothetical protein